MDRFLTCLKEWCAEVEKHHAWHSWFFNHGVLFDKNHEGLDIAYHLLQDSCFRESFLSHIKTSLCAPGKTRLFILSRIAQYQLYTDLNIQELLRGSTRVQHYRLWRFLLSALCEKNSWHDLIDLCMFCIDFMFYTDDHQRQNMTFQVILEFIFFIKMHKLCTKQIFRFLLKERDLFFMSQYDTLLLFSDLQSYLFEKREQHNFAPVDENLLKTWLECWNKTPSKYTLRKVLAQFKVDPQIIGPSMKMLSDNQICVGDIMSWLYESKEIAAKHKNFLDC